MNIICWLIGHKDMKIFENNFIYLNDDRLEKVEHMKLCERCKLVFWN